MLKKQTVSKQHEVSTLWQALSEELYSNFDEDFLSIFREPRNPANRLSTWQPRWFRMGTGFVIRCATKSYSNRIESVSFRNPLWLTSLKH